MFSNWYYDFYYAADCGLWMVIGDAVTSQPDELIGCIIGGLHYGTMTGVNNPVRNQAPEIYRLYPAYPNPFNPTTTIRYALPKSSPVRIAVSDIRGRIVLDLDRGTEQPGYHEFVFDGNNLASGVYLYRMQAGEFRETRRLVLVR